MASIMAASISARCVSPSNCPPLHSSKAQQPLATVRLSSSPCGLKSSLLAIQRLNSSSFAGASVASFSSPPSTLRQGNRLIVRAGGTSMACTKRSASRKKRARVSGFRVRIRTTNGLNVLKRRRAKGRKVLVPQSNPSSGKRA